MAIEHTEVLRDLTNKIFTKGLSSLTVNQRRQYVVSAMWAGLKSHKLIAEEILNKYF